MSKILAAVACGAVALLFAPLVEAKVGMVSFTSVVSPDDYATLTVKVSPRARCTIKVVYDTSISKAKGLGPKTGTRVTWQWKVGSSTHAGRWPVIVNCGNSGKLSLGLRVSRTEPTKAEYFAQVAEICRVYGPQLDKIRPPDVAEPANVIVAVKRALPLIRAQVREVKALEAPSALRAKLALWFRLQDRRIGMLERALRAARRQDFRALSVAYVDFILAGPETARLGSAIGIPHPPC